MSFRALELPCLLGFMNQIMHACILIGFGMIGKNSRPKRLLARLTCCKQASPPTEVSAVLERSQKPHASQHVI